MMKALLIRAASAILLAGLPFLAFPGEILISGGNTGLRLTVNNYQHLSFTNEISSLRFRDVRTKLGTFTELYVQGSGYSSGVGDPMLPVSRNLIEIPIGAVPQVEIIAAGYTDYSFQQAGITFPVIPQQESVSKAITDPDEIPFVINAATYLRNEFLGGPLVSVSDAGEFRALRLASLDIAPVQYNPVTGVLRIYSTIEAKVTFTGGDGQATIARKKQLFSPYFENAYREVANYKPLSDELITAAPVTMIIVSSPMFESALQPFIDWKTRKGFRVVEAYTDDPAVGNTTASIKSYLTAFYNSPPSGYEPQSFVLIVGDVPQVPAFSGTAGSHPTDLYYCEYTGDKIPECFYGRFSAGNVTQLQPQIDKTMEYEQYLFPDDTFLGEVVMVAGADPTYGELHGNGQINYGTNYYFNSEHGILSHTYLQPEPGGGNYSYLIKQNVSNGVSFANYTAHGSEQGWANPSFLISDIANLQNAGKYCLMVGNCCLTNRFNTTCFGEELLRAANKGALGYIGGSNNTYWNEDYWWGVGFKSVSTNPPYNPSHLGAYDVTFHDHGEDIGDWFVTQGQMVVGGNLAVQESNASSSSKTYYWEIYHLMGDPSLMVYLSVPPALTATYDDPLLVGVTSLQIVTEPYAYIGLSTGGDSFVAAACADSTGTATLVFDPLNNPGYLGIVVTKQNFKPLIDSIQVIEATGPYLVLASYTVSDSAGGNNNNSADYGESITLNLSVSNIGIATAYNVSAVMSAADTNITVTDSTCVIDSIPAGATVICSNAFSMTVSNSVADQHIVASGLLFDDGTDTWASDLLLTLNAPLLAVNGFTVLDPAPGGNNNGILDPGESAVLQVATVNAGHAGVGNGMAHLSVQPASNPYIIVTNPDCYIGNMPVNTVINVNFSVITNGITPMGTIVGLDLTESAGQQNQYTAQEEFEIEIGEVPVYVMQNGVESTCNAGFYDSGNSDQNYGNSENLVMTFFPSANGASIKAIFTEFDVEPATNCNYDYLNIYDGSTVYSPLIGKFCGTDSPGTVQSTSPDGALTFKFISDYADTFPGWAASVVCVGGPLTVMANAFPSTVCQGSSSYLSAIPTGGSGTYTFQWEPATYLDDPAIQFPVCTPDAGISYTVTVSDGVNTITSAPVDVAVVPVPEPPVATLNGDILESSEPGGNQWYFNGAAIPGATQQTYTPTVSGEYYVTVTDGTTGCESGPSNIIPYWITGAGTVLADKLVNVYPNPFTDRLTISYTVPGTSASRITLTDAFGRLIRVISESGPVAPGNNTVSVNCGDLDPGIYYCRIRTDFYTVVRKIMLIR